VATNPVALSIGIVHGPNLNLLGRREPQLYGTMTLAEIDSALVRLGKELGADVACFQSNAEGALVDHIQATAGSVQGFVVNAAAYTHTSIAIRDALVAVARPFVEVHLSNIFGREAFRRRSLLAAPAVGVVSGFGPNSYFLGLRALVEHLRGEPSRAEPAS
jgi:3-dehydroquinate dehydratase II